MVDQYIFSGSLPEEATTYVTREADGELYEGLKAGKFCYVLNSRQSGKSSLRVRTMRRLRESGVECAAIDLSAGGIQNVPPEQWYADLIDTLIESFGLDVDFGDWWSQNQLNSLVTRFRKFLEEILLAEIKENIVIFIDEIDSVLSLNFPTDDFFAFIRACYNQRVDNPEYNRLTFCLLGVASPSNLIEDKKRTPFNIGKAISLKGFQLHEVEPLEKGLHGRYSDSQAVMKEILHWTGGQPFLTQKLCQFMVESERDNPRTVEQVVRSRLIENWESQDEPEHFRTIRDRILRDEQRASYLLQLYQQIRCSEEQSEITANETQEQSELQLSGLVVRQQNKLRVYNPIYKEIFEQNWIETQLRNLRPYSENFKFWVASGGSDESRLLRGKALQDALEWSKDKSLNYQDREFLAASQAKEREEEIAALEKEAALERERKDREAAEQRNQILAEANRKAQREIRKGIVFLSVTLFAAVIFGIVAVISGSKVIKAQKQLQKIERYIVDAQNLRELANKLSSYRLYSEASEISRLAEVSKQIKDSLILNQAFLHASKSLAYQYLEKWDEAKFYIENSMKLLKTRENEEISRKYSSQDLQIKLFAWTIFGKFLKQQNNNQEAIKAYKEAFNILKTHNDITLENNLPKIIDRNSIKSIHKVLIELLPDSEKKIRSEVETSLKNYYLFELEDLMKARNWKEADQTTTQLIFIIAKRAREGSLDIDSINNISCPDLKKIDQLWLTHSDGHFGFSTQKRIFLNTGNKLDLRLENVDEEAYKRYKRYAVRVGWYDEKRKEWKYTHFSDLDLNITAPIHKNVPKGYLPSLLYPYHTIPSQFFSRCDL